MVYLLLLLYMSSFSIMQSLDHSIFYHPVYFYLKTKFMTMVLLVIVIDCHRQSLLLFDGGETIGFILSKIPFSSCSCSIQVSSLIPSLYTRLSSMTIRVLL